MFGWSQGSCNRFGNLLVFAHKPGLSKSPNELKSRILFLPPSDFIVIASSLIYDRPHIISSPPTGVVGRHQCGMNKNDNKEK
jgi:hypothetical protein